MKILIFKVLCCLAMPALALSAFFISCTDELSREQVPNGGQTGETEVTFKLEVPGQSTGGGTRALTDGGGADSKVDDLYILAFAVDRDDQSETFDYVVAARMSGAPGNSRWTANLKVKPYDQRFVMVANVQGTQNKVNEKIGALAGTSAGKPKDTVLRMLTETLGPNERTEGFKAESDTDHHPFTMVGQTSPQTITADKGMTIGVTLRRIMAQVQVVFTGDAAEPGTFIAESVSLYNFNDRAQVVHDLDVPAGPQVPGIPQDAVRLPERIDGKEKVPTYNVTDNTIKNAIYLFEVLNPDVPQGETEDKLYTQRPCLVVKGRYKGENESSYYRVDFADRAAPTAFFDIMRNHSYNVTISGVLGKGHDTPQQAVLSKSADIVATVVEWDNTDMDDTVIDGEKMLGIATMRYELGKKARTDLLQQVKASKGLEWSVTLYEVAGDGTVDTQKNPDWVSFVDADGGNPTKTKSATGNNDLQDLNFTVTKNDQVPERRAVMRFSANSLQIDALVIQDQSTPAFINVTVNGRPVTELEFKQVGGYGETMHIEYGPEDVELSWKISESGVIFNETDVDGNKTADKNGTDRTGLDEETKTITWNANANNFDSMLDYETRRSVLTLIAKKSTGEIDVKNVVLTQKKYGFMLETTTVPCTGAPFDIKVKGNMPWTAEIKGNGYDDVLANDMIEPVSGTFEGEPTEEYSDQSALRFTTNKADLRLGMKTAEVTFTNTLDGSETIKNVGFVGALEYDGAYYQILGPVQRSIKEIKDDVKYTHSDGTVDLTATIINTMQASALEQAGINDYNFHQGSNVVCQWLFQVQGESAESGIVNEGETGSVIIGLGSKQVVTVEWYNSVWWFASNNMAERKVKHGWMEFKLRNTGYSWPWSYIRLDVTATKVGPGFAMRRKGDGTWVTLGSIEGERVYQNFGGMDKMMWLDCWGQFDPSTLWPYCEYKIWELGKWDPWKERIQLIGYGGRSGNGQKHITQDEAQNIKGATYYLKRLTGTL